LYLREVHSLSVTHAQSDTRTPGELPAPALIQFLSTAKLYRLTSPPLPFLLPILILVQLEAIRVTHVKMVHNKVFKTRLFLGSLVRVQTVGLNISESYVFYYFFISICVRLVHRVSFPLSHRCFLFDFVRNVLGEERVGIYALRGTLRV